MSSNTPLDKLNKNLKSHKKPEQKFDPVAVPEAEKGVKDGYKRFTFIANKEQLEMIKAIAWYDRGEMKEVIETAIANYLDNRNDLKKVLKAYRDKNG